MDMCWAYVGHRRVICWQLCSWLVVELEIFLQNLVGDQNYLISVDLDLCLLIILTTVPTAVVVSMCIGADGWGCPNYVRIRRMNVDFFAFTHNAPSSASAADAVTTFKIAHVIAILPLSWIGVLTCSQLPSEHSISCQRHKSVSLYLDWDACS